MNSHDHEPGALLRNLLPDDIAVCFSASCPTGATLYEAELPCTRGMVPKRLQEFTHGRYCARTAMAELGVTPVAIPKAADRSPIWPEGVTGAITHTGAIAAAALGPSARYAGIGLDIEAPEPLDDATREMILRPEEQPADGRHAKLLFSIKEAIYKCIYPAVGMYVDFREMGVQLEPAEGSFRALPACDRFAPETIAGLLGRYRVTDDWVAAAAWLPKKPD